eukprot:m.25008 g.25008  ORF g.25008 m.25008 type:complete len:472 (-) comp7664_c0_seq1:72-1487(-)
MLTNRIGRQLLQNQRRVAPSASFSHNWAGNISWSAPVVSPTSQEELQDLIRNTPGKVRVLGTGHSFTPIANSEDLIVSLKRLPRKLELNKEKSTVTVDGGATLFELASYLRENGYALKNTPSLPHITVAGAVLTATHGSSGVSSVTGKALLGNQSSQTSAMTFISPTGDLFRCERDGENGDVFPGCVVSFGTLGPVSELTLDVVPEYEVLQAMYGHMGPDAPKWSTDTLINNFDELLTDTDSFSVFPDWVEDSGGMIVMRHFGHGVQPAGQWHGVNLTIEDLPPMLGTTVDMKSTFTGPSSEVLFWFIDEGKEYGPQPPHEIQLEYFVPLDEAKKALETVRNVSRHWGTKIEEDPLGRNKLLYCELRAVAADDLWLSQTTTIDGRDTLALAFGMNKFAGMESVNESANQMERALAEAGLPVRPHWAKVSTYTPSQIRSFYPEGAKNFASLCDSMDPTGKFRNDYVNAIFFP